MAKGRIAGHKVDKVATILVAELRKKVSEIEKEMILVVKEEYSKNTPQDVKDFAKKYPDLVRKAESPYISLKNTDGTFSGRYFSLKDVTRTIVEQEVMFPPNSKVVAELSALNIKRGILSADVKTLRNKVACTISKMGTYRKLEKEFPEAYKVLVMEVDKEEVDTTQGLCGDVDALRATLKATK